MTGMRKLLMYGSILGIPVSFLQKRPINVLKEKKLPPLSSPRCGLLAILASINSFFGYSSRTG